MAQSPGPMDPNFGMSIADLLRKQAANVAGDTSHEYARQNAESQSKNLWEAPKSPIQQLMEQIQGINIAPTPLEQLQALASNQASGQFDPLIQALQGEMQSKQSRGVANQGEARQMYGSLADDIANQLPEITNRMSQASQQAQDQYANTQNAMQGEYQKNAQAQNELFQKLGIQAAAPDASQQAMDDQAYFQQQSKLDETNAVQALQQMMQSDVGYNQKTSQNTRLAGENTAQDIGNQLEDYMTQANSKLGGLQSGKQSAMNAMLQQLQMQDQQRIQTGQQAEYQKMMDMAKLQMDMQRLGNETLTAQSNATKALGAGGQSDSLFKGTNSQAGAANYLGEAYKNDSYTQNAIMDAINRVLGSKEAIAGQYEDPNSPVNPVTGKHDTLKVNDRYLQDQLRAAMQGGGNNGPHFETADVNNAINALMAMLGKLA